MIRIFMLYSYVQQLIMDTKLTLKLDKSIIEEAKKYASKKKISLSKMIETYLKSLTQEDTEDLEITPFVESLSGIVQDIDTDYKKDYSDHLQEKHK